jgi:gamma-glutamylcyclotransferase (GGCT)/AIG2-like uncharacterized protein YtfP
MTQSLFVYGLLREGQNYGHILAGCTRSGPHTVEGVALYDLGEYPGAVRAPAVVVGDVYEIEDAAVLDILDRLEGVHEQPPLYIRESCQPDGQSDAWIYLYDRPVGEAPRIASGDWLNR